MCNGVFEFFYHFMYFSTVFFFSVILSCVRLSHFIKEPAAAAAGLWALPSQPQNSASTKLYCLKQQCPKPPSDSEHRFTANLPGV